MQLICVDEQHFSEIRKRGGVFVDKTRIMYDLFKDGKYFFISRPRRFGKSTLCSTLAALFAGKREFFKDLWIDKSDWNWQEHPVIHLDMTKASSPEGNMQRVIEGVLLMLEDVKKNYGLEQISEVAPANYFGALIKALCEKTGKQVVIIIDEYDKPLLDVIHHKDKYPGIHDLLRDFYSQLKANSEYLRFVLLTGVFKFAKTSVFSGLNNITDLTFDPTSAELLGYTEQEIVDNFPEHLAELAAGHGKTVPEMQALLREKYNGYSFGVNLKKSEVVGSVYNPFAINHVFHAQQLLDRWFISATPTFLINKLKEDHFQNLDAENLITKLSKLDGSSGPDHLETLHVLYYAGYLTLKQYNSENSFVALNFPNVEVAQSMSDLLLPLVTQKPENAMMRLADNIRKSLAEESIEKLKDLLNQALAQVPYHLFGTQESYYQTVIYLLFAANNISVVAEDIMNRGRADLTVILPHIVYVFELKMNQPATVALDQIKQRDYAAKYRYLNRKINLVGIELSNKDRVVKEIATETCQSSGAITSHKG